MNKHTIQKRGNFSISQTYENCKVCENAELDDVLIDGICGRCLLESFGEARNTEILQRIYDSEIHLRIGWMWDGGVDCILGASCFDLWSGDDEIIRTGETDIGKAILSIANFVAMKYPKSTFAKWWHSPTIKEKRG